jgi:hypothetical protein
VGDVVTLVDQSTLRLEVEVPATGLVNQIENPSGELGGWGWVTPTPGATMSSVAGSLVYNYVAGANTFYNEPAECAPNQWVAASLICSAVTGTAYGYRTHFEFLDATGAVILSTTVQPTGGAFGPDSNRFYTNPYQAPAGTVSARLVVAVVKGDMTNPTGTGKFYFKEATLLVADSADELGITRVNLCTNPSAETNVSGWAVGGDTNAISRVSTGCPHPVAGSWVFKVTPSPFSPRESYVGFTVDVLPLRNYAVALDMYGDPRDVPTGTWDVTKGAGVTAMGFLFQWFNDDWAIVAPPQRVTTTPPAAGSLTMKRVQAVAQAPAGASRLIVGPFVTYKAGNWAPWFFDAVLIEQADTVGSYFDGDTYLADGFLYSWSGASGASTSVAWRPGIPYVAPVPYLDLLGDVATINIDRGELNLGTLTATVVNSALDPAVADTIDAGRRCRLMAKTGTSGDTSDWQPIITATVKQAQVAYNLLQANKQKRATITLTAADAVSKLAKTPAATGVATIGQLPYVLEGAGVPWNVNGSGAQVASATAASYNDSASVVDQVALTRDSALGYAWVDRHNVLQAWDASKLDATVKATLDESVYNADVSIDFDTDRVIDAVQVTLLTYDAGHGVATSTVYPDPNGQGAYVLPGTKGEHLAQFTVAGLTPAQIPAYANQIMAANGTPKRRVNSVVVPITTENLDLALLDLYDLVRVVNVDAGIDENHRIVGITHSITAQARGTGGPGGMWLMTINFVGDGTVAMPQMLPTPQTGKVGASGTSQVVQQQLAGSVEITPTGSSAPYAATATVTFDIPFPVAPFVTLTAWTSKPDQVHVSLDGGPTTEDFVILLKRDDAATTTSVHWQAAGT